MKYVIFAVIYLLIYLLPGFKANVSIYKCPLYRQYFQKILFYRPIIASTPLEPHTNLLQNNKNNNNYPTLSHRNETTRNVAINLDCWTKCKTDIECSGYVLFFNSSECYGLTHVEGSKKFYPSMDNDHLVSDSNAVFFEKICLNNVPVINKNKLWLFTKIPGSSLVFQGKKTLPMLVDRSRCAEECLHEKEFQCLSATYISSHRNNYVRFEKYIQNGGDEQLGTCILSSKDKTTQPDAFRVSTGDEEYIENQCAQRGTEADSCSYEVYPQNRLIYADVEYRNLSEIECKERCATENRFYCQGISYYDPRYGLAQTKCLIHSEDVISLGPRSLVVDQYYVYMRRVQCLNVTVVCSKTQMLINYAPHDYFIGRMYVNSHSEECTVQGKGVKSALLRIPIGNELKEKRCGIIRAYQIDAHSNVNRTLLSTLIVIQTNPIVQTQGDRLVKVGCIIDNNLHENGQIDDIALGSSLTFRNSKPPNEGSLLLNTTGTTPRVSMRIVDLAEHTQIMDVSLGQNLELQISLDPSDSIYDIRAVQLIAKSDSGHSSIMLLDQRGCPTDLSVFPQLEKRTTNSSRILYGRFHAFKFAGSSYVNFEVIIQFCLHECAPVNCGPNMQSHGRKKRNIIKTYPNSNSEITAASMNPMIDGTILAGQTTLSNLSLINNRGNSKTVYSILNQNISEINKIHVESNEIISQRVLGGIAQEIEEAAEVAELSRQNFSDPKRVLKQLVEVPLQVKLNVRVPDSGPGGSNGGSSINNGNGDSESLIYGENNQILVAGYDQETSANLVCINQTLIILLAILWFLIQIILLSSCFIVIRKYKRLAQLEDDQTSLQKMQQEFENRRVTWADQGRSHVLMYT